MNVMYQINTNLQDNIIYIIVSVPNMNHSRGLLLSHSLYSEVTKFFNKTLVTR